ncbi:unnamed protein product [Alopecurus aequalis]
MAGSKVMSNAAVAAALVALLVVAAAPSAAGFHGCGVDTDELAKQCRSYCTVGSTESAPSAACCLSVKHCNYDCLCGFRTALPADIDQTRAMQIPSMCHVPGARSSCAKA